MEFEFGMPPGLGHIIWSKKTLIVTGRKFKIMRAKEWLEWQKNYGKFMIKEDGIDAEKLLFQMLLEEVSERPTHAKGDGMGFYVSRTG